MKKVLLLSLSGIGLAFAGPTPVPSSGAYINLNAGTTTAMQFLPANGFAFNANAGYNFAKGLAVEGGYTQLTSQQYGALYTNNIFDVAVKGTIHLSDIFALYGRTGPALNYTSWGGFSNSAPSWFNNQHSSTEFNWLAAVGVSFSLSSQFDLRIEDMALVPVGYSNNLGAINAVMGGVQFYF